MPFSADFRLFFKPKNSQARLPEFLSPDLFLYTIVYQFVVFENKRIRTGRFERYADSFIKTYRPSERRKSRYFLLSFAQLSFKPTVRLNRG